MTLQKAVELITLGIKGEGPDDPDDFIDAVRIFLPLMQAAAYIESLHRVPVVRPMKEGV